ncbi:MAG: class I SAM-dependent methyltransferase [Actinomycetes bacterium]
MQTDAVQAWQNDRRRRSFDEVAELYDRARPGYPPELLGDLSALAGLDAGSRVLEVGPGTGQLTVALASSGFRIVAVELGGDLARILERNVAAFENVEIARTAFEDWPLSHEPFDLVVFATAFHWIEPAVRLVKSATALKPGGALAIIRTRPIAGGSPRFAELATPCYRRWIEADAFDLPDRDSIPVDRELDDSPLFMDEARRTYVRDLTFTSREYVDLLATWSPNRALTEPARAGLLTCLEQLIDSHFDGSVTMTHLSELQVARKRA